MFWFWKKRDIENLKEETKKGFDAVKKDVTSVSGWIRHLESEKNLQKREISEIKENLSSVKDEIENLKNIVEMIGNLNPNKQTAV